MKNYNFTGKKIWVADDYEGIRESMADLLRMNGAEVLEFSSPEQVNKQLEQSVKEGGGTGCNYF